jgi:hypothetical protein
LIACAEITLQLGVTSERDNNICEYHTANLPYQYFKVTVTDALKFHGLQTAEVLSVKLM